MQKNTSFFTTVFISAISLCLSAGSLLAEEQVLARVNGQAITADTLAVLQDSRQQGPLSDLEQNQHELLDSLITTELLFSAAKQAKLDTNKYIALELELAHKTLLSQFYVMQYMDQLNFDEAILKAAYDAQAPEKMARMAYWSFDSKAAAETFLAKAQNDTTGTLDAGEELPWQTLENYPFAHLPETATLANGQWLSVPIQDELGWMVWRCLETSTIPKPTFEDAREGIRQELATQRLQAHIESLRADATIQNFLQDQ